jgi:ADP-ribose pyrophosphatase YjhB (NUDIX family)
LVLRQGLAAAALSREAPLILNGGVSFSLETAKTWLIQRAAALRHRLWFGRAMTLGVRAVVLDKRKVLLVRHTYVKGWHLPGGAVDRGESAESAVVRELREECGVCCTERPALHGFYRNRRHSRRDHVACFLVRGYTALPRVADWEIAECRFFSVDALPEDATPATRARLAEILGGATVDEEW